MYLYQLHYHSKHYKQSAKHTYIHVSIILATQTYSDSSFHFMYLCKTLDNLTCINNSTTKIFILHRNHWSFQSICDYLLGDLRHLLDMPYTSTQVFDHHYWICPTQVLRCLIITTIMQLNCPNIFSHVSNPQLNLVFNAILSTLLNETLILALFNCIKTK